MIEYPYIVVIDMVTSKMYVAFIVNCYLRNKAMKFDRDNAAQIAAFMSLATKTIHTIEAYNVGHPSI